MKPQLPNLLLMLKTTRRTIKYLFNLPHCSCFLWVGAVAVWLQAVLGQTNNQKIKNEKQSLVSALFAVQLFDLAARACVPGLFSK